MGRLVPVAVSRRGRETTRHFGHGGLADCGLLLSQCCFALCAKHRSTLGIVGELVVAAFYPLAVSRLWRERRSTLGVGAGLRTQMT